MQSFKFKITETLCTIHVNNRNSSIVNASVLKIRLALVEQEKLAIVSIWSDVRFLLD